MERVIVVSRVCGCPLFDWIAEQPPQSASSPSSSSSAATAAAAVPASASVSPSREARWNSEQRKASAAAAIIQIFYQLAKDLGGTSVVRVRFDHPSAGLDAVNGSMSPSSAAASSTSHLPSAATKRASNRSFPRYAHTMQSRPMMAPYAATAAAGSRRGTAINGEADSGGGSVQPRSASPPPAPPPPFSPSSPPESAVSGAAVHRYDMFAVENDAILLAIFVSPAGDASAAVADGDTASALRDEFHGQYRTELADSYPAFLQLAHRPEQALLDSRFLPVFAAFTTTLQRLGFFHYHGPPADSQQQHNNSADTGQSGAAAAAAAARDSRSSNEDGANLSDIELQQAPVIAPPAAASSAEAAVHEN